MKKILITGASGFIGSYIVEEALSRNYVVYASVREKSNLSYIFDSRIKHVVLNFSDAKQLKIQLAKCPDFDFIIHNAGLTNALKRSHNFITNYEYTKNLVDALIELKKVPQKFIYMSSLAAQGPGDENILNTIKVSDIPRPVTSYGKSKLKAENYIAQCSCFPYLIIRPTAVYGPRGKGMSVLYKLTNNRIQLIIGFKKQYLTFIYVKDLAVALFHALESSIVNAVFFVSDGKVYNSKIFYNKIKAQLGKDTYRIKVPVLLVRALALVAEGKKLITGKQSFLNLEKINELESVNWKCDVSPLFEDLNFRPKYSLNQGISETIHWYKEELKMLK